MPKRQHFPQSQYTAPTPTPTQRLRLLAALTPAQPHIIYLRDGEVVVYRRTRSLLYQCRYKLTDGSWVEMLLLTGMRHGTEAMGIRWKNIEWHTKDGVRYLRIWVDGKTGGRWLIAKHRAVDVLKRLHANQDDIKDIAFEDLFATRAHPKM